MMTIFVARGSCSFASHIVLEEAGAQYSAHYLDLKAGEHLSTEYRAINPKGKVPALKVDDEIITENVAIQYYIAHRFPESRLCPDEPDRKISWLSFITWISNSVQPDARHITRPGNYSDDASTFPAIERKGRCNFATWLSEFDKRLEGSRWMMGEQYTTADPYALVFLAAAMRLAVPVSGHKNCERWAQRMLERPAVRKILTLEDDILLSAVCDTDTWH